MKLILISPLWFHEFFFCLFVFGMDFLKFSGSTIQGMGGMVKCCGIDGCNTGIASPADNSNRFTNSNSNPTRFGTQNNPTAPTIQQMNDFISNLPGELPGAPLGSFLQQQPFNTNQQQQQSNTFLNQQAFISSNSQVSTITCYSTLPNFTQFNSI